MKNYNEKRRYSFSNKILCSLVLLLVILPLSGHTASTGETVDDEQFFTLQNGTNLRSFGGSEVLQLLFRKRGSVIAFGDQQNRALALDE